MAIEIRNRWTGTVILTVEAENLSNANLSYVNLSGANLSYVNLSYVNLSYANLSNANLSNANLSYVNLSYVNLSGADLSYANLSNANLSYADLSGANLSDADLSDVTGNLKQVKSIHTERWVVTYTGDTMFIGCQTHALTEWWGFDDRTINAMDVGALKWWRKWKPILQAVIEASPAKPTKTETEATT